MKPLQERREKKTAAGNGAEDGARGLSPVLDRYMYPLDYSWSSNLEAKRRLINKRTTKSQSVKNNQQLTDQEQALWPCPPGHTARGVDAVSTASTPYRVTLHPSRAGGGNRVPAGQC